MPSVTETILGTPNQHLLDIFYEIEIFNSYYRYVRLISDYFINDIQE